MTYVTRNLEGRCIAAYDFKEMTPSEPLYFLVSFKRRFADGLVIFWGPNEAGYTPDIKQAGAYNADQAARLADDDTVPVPVDWLHQNCRVRMCIDQGDTHATKGMFWNADNLRAAVPNATGKPTAANEPTEGEKD